MEKLHDKTRYSVQDERHGDIWFAGYREEDLEELMADEYVIAIMDESTGKVYRKGLHGWPLLTS